MKPLIDELKKYNLTLYTIGLNSQKLYNLAKDANIEVYPYEYMEDAVKDIDKVLAQDEVALLSPACASLDQFASYAQRGDIFIETIKNLSVN